MHIAHLLFNVVDMELNEPLVSVKAKLAGVAEFMQANNLPRTDFIDAYLTEIKATVQKIEERPYAEG